VSKNDTFINKIESFIYGKIAIKIMGRIIKIYEALLNRKEKICHKSEIIEIIDEYNRTLGKVNAKNTLKYLSRHGYIRRIFLHFYYINSMDERERGFCAYEDRELLFVVLNRVGIKWYLGMSSALYLSGKTWQTPNILTIINNNISGKKKILEMNVRFFKIKDTLIFGLKRGRTKNNIRFLYSDQAKTHIDIVYFRKSSKIIVVNHTAKYLRRYPKWLRKSI
jgi:predicted transcriptional regulator of viral defense system